MTGDSRTTAGGDDSAGHDARDLLEETRQRVMNVVGHALRTPMATLRGQVEVLAKTDDPDERSEVIASLLQSARRLERLLDDVLVAAKIDTRLPADQPREVAVGAAVLAVWAKLSPEVDLDLSGAPETSARVSPTALDWMLRHVLDNALRYGTGRVTVEVASEISTVVVTVANRPRHPVTDAELDRAGELFYRGEGAVMDSATRPGVGLTVVDRLAAQIGAGVELRETAEGLVEAVIELPR